MNQQQPSTEFSGRNVLITGAASGIGLAIAEHLAVRGARVAGVDVAADPQVRALLDAGPAAGPDRAGRGG